MAARAPGRRGRQLGPVVGHSQPQGSARKFAYTAILSLGFFAGTPKAGEGAETGRSRATSQPPPAGPRDQLYYGPLTLPFMEENFVSFTIQKPLIISIIALINTPVPIFPSSSLTLSMGRRSRCARSLSFKLCLLGRVSLALSCSQWFSNSRSASCFKTPRIHMRCQMNTDGAVKTLDLATSNEGYSSARMCAPAVFATPNLSLSHSTHLPELGSSSMYPNSSWQPLIR